MTIRTLPELIRRFQQVTSSSHKQNAQWATNLLSRYQGDDWKQWVAYRSVPFVLYKDEGNEDASYALEMFHWSHAPHAFPIRLLPRAHYTFRVLAGEVLLSSRNHRMGVFREHPYSIHHDATYRYPLRMEGQVNVTSTVLIFRQAR